jgi:outer membrane protein OmpA-like peptidoglycan-associated protein
MTNGVWSSPVNLGYGINDHLDQLAMIITYDGKKGYFSVDNKDENGRFVSKLATIELQTDTMMAHAACYITGRIRDKNNDRPIQAKISLYDLMTGESLYETSSDPISGQFYFVITTQRDIGVFVTSKGYMFRDFHFESKGSSAIRPDTLNILLDPLSSGISTTLQNIYFDWNSAELDQRSTQAIEMIVKFMEQHPVILEIHGHTDNTGSAAYNKELSYKRAQAVANALKKRGISDHRVRIYGHGSAYLIDKNPENQDQNRRIEFRISL